MGLFDQATPCSLRRGRIRYFPVAPGRLEFAAAVREEILREPPSVVAVELPATLERAYRQALERLPALSVVLYETAQTEAVYLPVEPTDPFVEALRTARELRLESAFLDPDVSERPHLDDIYPDSYALERIGLRKYVEAFRLTERPHDPEAAIHAEALAWKLQGCDPEAEILAVVSLNLLDPLLEAMEHPQTQPLRKVKRKGVRALNLHPDSLAEVCTEAPFLQAIYEARRSGKAPAAPQLAQVRPQAGGFEVIEPPKEHPSAQAVREAARTQPDRQKDHFRLLAATELAYERKSGERLATWQRRTWARYSRNLAIASGQLLPNLFDMTAAARGVADDEFAWEFWLAASYYPGQSAEAELPTAKISGDQMWDGTRKMRLRPRLRTKKGKPKPAGLRGRKGEEREGEFEREFQGRGICSYPPEDLRIEEYGLFLKNKGKSLLSEERARTEPFTTSLRDGVDLRETLRNWHDGKRIYVRENQRAEGEVGAVVIIFDEDRDNRYPYAITWLGEKQNESDMAFYATNPFENAVGPGIGRAEYGGLLLSLPSQRMIDVWSDPDYFFAESKPETLLLAALDYSLEKIIVYAAPKPPRSIFRTLAGRMGRRIVYVPLGTLNRATVKKLRTMHVLDGHEKRDIARDYVW
ncbi:MAG: hypothetical protein KDC27_11535 [Acidobacteria bacterium]|nr:hypothetical protein [Acidobacteriota bacterium]